MTIRQLLQALIGHVEDGRMLEDEVTILVGGQARRVESSFSDGTFILIAGDPINR